MIEELTYVCCRHAFDYWADHEKKCIGFEPSTKGIIKLEFFWNSFIGKEERFDGGKGFERLCDIGGILLIGMISMEDGDDKNSLIILVSKGDFDGANFSFDEVDICDA